MEEPEGRPALPVVPLAALGFLGLSQASKVSWASCASFEHASVPKSLKDRATTCQDVASNDAFMQPLSLFCHVF